MTYVKMGVKYLSKEAIIVLCYQFGRLSESDKILITLILIIVISENTTDDQTIENRVMPLLEDLDLVKTGLMGLNIIDDDDIVSWDTVQEEVNNLAYNATVIEKVIALCKSVINSVQTLSSVEQIMRWEDNTLLLQCPNPIKQRDLPLLPYIRK